MDKLFYSFTRLDITRHHPNIACMNINPTIPCPVCDAPVYIRYLRLASGDIARVYTDPLLSDEEVFTFHQHQVTDIDERILH